MGAVCTCANTFNEGLLINAAPEDRSKDAGDRVLASDYTGPLFTLAKASNSDGAVVYAQPEGPWPQFFCGCRCVQQDSADRKAKRPEIGAGGKTVSLGPNLKLELAMYLVQ